METIVSVHLRNISRWYFLLIVSLGFLPFGCDATIGSQAPWVESALQKLIHPHAYEVTTYENQAEKVFSITYKVRLSYPSTAVFEYYDQELSRQGWNPTFRDYASRQWTTYIDGTKEGEPRVHQFGALWVNPTKTQMILLGLRYYTYGKVGKEEGGRGVPETDIQEVVYQVMPFSEPPSSK